ncbi:MAG: polyprenyl synthetase family protein [Cytophagales bacterium]|nr:polyprenyl synthetase family protein [Armatimonadota bacterium]
MTSRTLTSDNTSSPVSLLGLIEGELQKVEARLIAETRSDVGAVRDISGHTLLSGGKRLRPALAILCARTAAAQRTSFVYPEDRVIAAAAAAEMIHMATLMHDDVVDEAPERRGRPTASAVYGNSITILTGDYLLAKSISLLAHNDENLHVVRVFSDVTVTMAEGEVLQDVIAHNLDIPLETYEEVIERKTARFLAGCCETGAMLGGADAAEAAALRAYGHHLGNAFQIADDLLDFLGNPKKTGKSLGTDLRDGRVTLPLIHALAQADSETRESLRVRLAPPGGAMTDADIAAITATIQRLGGFEAAQKVAEERTERAIKELRRFPASPHRDALERLARFVVARDR